MPRDRALVDTKMLSQSNLRTKAVDKPKPDKFARFNTVGLGTGKPVFKRDAIGGERGIHGGAVVRQWTGDTSTRDPEQLYAGSGDVMQ